MKAIKGHFDSGRIILAEPPDMASPTDVIVVFPGQGMTLARSTASASRRLYDLNMQADKQVMFSLEDGEEIELVPEQLPTPPRLPSPESCSEALRRSIEGSSVPTGPFLGPLCC